MSDNSNVHISNDLINVKSQARNSFPDQQLMACYTASFLHHCDKSTWQKQLKEAFTVSHLLKVLLGRHSRTHGLGGRTLKFVHIWTVQGAKSLGWA